jgi:dCMP deaminase
MHYGPSTSTPSTPAINATSASPLANGVSAMTDFSRVMSLATVKVDNCFSSVEALWAYLDTLNLLDEERLRPGWDTYFMVSLFYHWRG